MNNPKMASSEKRCLYEVLGISRDCTTDEIRSAYKKLALQRHPDKLVRSGVSEADATASFQELINAYEVLSDPRERAWYDSHRSQILFSGSDPSNSSNSIPNLFSFFSNSVFSGYSDTGKGFYKVYGELFDKIYSSELNFAKKLGLRVGAVKEAPLMGNMESPYVQVTAFYNYWLGFVTVMDFCWVDQYDAMAGPNRKSRRVMEEENKKLRKKARREYNETVRGLGEFVKKRDKRVIDMQRKRNEETERKREEEREKKRALERQKMERASAYLEPEWTQVNEDGEIEDDNEVEDKKKSRDGKELYCVACGKKFKSEKQWKNHEQSKKHKEKVEELREAFGNEEFGLKKRERKEEQLGDNVDGHGSVSDDVIDELSEHFGGGFWFQKRNSEDYEEAQSSEEEGFVDFDNGGASEGLDGSFGSDDDETSILEAMVSGHKSRKKRTNLVHQHKANPPSTKIHDENDNDEMDFLAYNKMKSTRRKRGTRGERSRRYNEEANMANETESSGQVGENNVRDDDDLQEGEALSHALVEDESNGKGDDQLEKRHKVPKPDDDLQEGEALSHALVEDESNGKGDDQLEKRHKVPKPVDRKGSAKKDTNVISKNSSKGRKQKASSKTSGNVCETCGEDFKSRNKLHKHLGDTGHATFKLR